MKPVSSVILVLLTMAVADAYAFPPLRGNERQERYEQNVAQRFDPYPSVGFGPEVDGARPREYLNPSPPVLQVQPRLPPATVNHLHRPFFHRAD